MLSRTVPLLCAALLAAPPTLRAQSVEEIAPGTRMRAVDAASGRVVGTLAEIRGDTLVVRSGRGEREHLVTLSVSSLRRLQVSRGTPSRPLSALQGAGIGAVSGAVGGVAGVTLARLSFDDDCDGTEDDLLCLSGARWTLIGVVIGAPLGAAWGAAIGFVFPQERWRSLPIRGAPAVTLNGSAGGLQLALSIPVP